MRKLTLAAACAIGTLAVSPSIPQQATDIQLTYSKGQFQPAEVRAPADKPVTFRVKNLDAKAMEFESKSLRVEKVVAANSEGIVNVRALKPGRYEFYDDFNEKARGALVVQQAFARASCPRHWRSRGVRSRLGRRHRARGHRRRTASQSLDRWRGSRRRACRLCRCRLYRRALAVVCGHGAGSVQRRHSGHRRHDADLAQCLDGASWPGNRRRDARGR